MFKKNFYRDCYVKTGWLPMEPMVRGAAVGDVVQLRNGRFQPLLNLAEAKVLEPCISGAVALDPADWRFSRGVQQAACDMRRSDGGEGEHACRTRQVLEFAEAGSFIFHLEAPKAALLTNWSQIRDDVTLKLTQLHFSFREAYVVTGVVAANDWALAGAGAGGGRMEMSASLASADPFSLLGHRSAQVEHCQGIAFHEKEHGTPAHLFKAKKLVLSDTMYDRYLGILLETQSPKRPPDAAAWFDGHLLDLVRSNELNLNTCINFFSWVDLTLDDVELLAG